MKHELKNETGYKRLVHIKEPEDKLSNSIIIEEIKNIYKLLKQKPINDWLKND